MSEIKVNSIKGVGASAAAITVNNTDGTCTANITNKPNRNLIINGAMQVAQRSTSAVTNASAGGSLKYETIDRWGYWANAASVFSVQQVDDSPADFQKSLKVTSLGARSMGGSDYFILGQGFEAQDIQHLNWGTANAKDCVLSFHVKSSLTGTFAGYLHGTNSFKPTYVFTYTISSANTWEKKTVTITAPGTAQAGDFGSAGSNTKGLELGFNLGVGTTYATATINAWQEGFFKIGTTTSVDVVATNGATWQVTGVQLEVGSVATDFEHRSFGDELARCQRYFERVVLDISELYIMGTNQFNSGTQIQKSLKTSMRATPTVTLDAATFSIYAIQGSGSNANVSFTPVSYTNNNIRFQMGSTGASTSWWVNKAATGYADATAEL